MSKGYRVSAVAGRTIADPFTTRHATATPVYQPQRRIGYTRTVDANRVAVDPRTGAKSPAVVYEFHGEIETVTETSDGFYRNAIKCGDLDYVSSVDVRADGTTSQLPFEPELMNATALNVAIRKRAAAASKPAEQNEAALRADAEAYAAHALGGAPAASVAPVDANAPTDDTTTHTTA